MSVRPRRQSLADAFAPPVGARDRAATLGGLLPPRPSEVATAPAQARLLSVPPEHDDASALGEYERQDVGQGSVEASPAPVSEPAGPAEAADLERVRNVAVYLPIDLLDRLKRTRLSRELTYADLLVEAAAAHTDGLQTAFEGGGPPPGASGMPTRSPRRRRTAEPGVQVQIRLDGHQLSWLDEQVRRLRAPSRTSLVVALLQAHLT